MNFLWVILIVALKVATVQSGDTSNSTDRLLTSRDGKAMSVFQVVRFPNIGCSGTSSQNGTCYSSSECLNKGGIAAGSCASGFGVCCTFTLTCGSTISENCTYFTSSTAPGAGQCGVTICKCSPDICQLRLDFNTFVITGPNTVTVSVFYDFNGSISTATAGIKASLATECQTDTFTVTSNGAGFNPPVICGINTGYHMYVPASNACNQMNFQLGTNSMGVSSVATRSWNIKISQISCLAPYLPPPGCTQFITGTTGVLNSYNFAGGTQLANQQQNVCVRKERGYCKICYSPTTISDFGISGMGTKGGYLGTGCCNYGTTGAAKQTWVWDCLMIPGARKSKTATKTVQNNFCGAYLVTIAATKANSTICSNYTPFMVNFQTDAFTLATAITSKQGFKLVYWETTTC
jgi:hypothetical protein